MKNNNTAGVLVGIAALLALLFGVSRATQPPVTTTSTSTTTTSTSVVTTTTEPTTTTEETTTTTEVSGELSFVGDKTLATIGRCEVFPANHYMNAINVDKAPVHPQSDQFLADIKGEPMRFPTSSTWEGSRPGIPINVVDSAKIGFSNVVVTGDSPSNYRGPFPIPTYPRIEGDPGSAWDKHVLIVDTKDCTAYEIIQYTNFFGNHVGWNTAKYPLNTTARPTKTTNAPDTPMIGQFVMRNEAKALDIPHVVSWCTNRPGTGVLWPALRTDGRSDTGVPSGAWIRLKSTADTSKLTGEAKAIAETLRTRGAVQTDTCNHGFYLHGENAADWPASTSQQLATLKADDFEVIDASALMVDPNTHEIR